MSGYGDRIARTFAGRMMIVRVRPQRAIASLRPERQANDAFQPSRRLLASIRSPMLSPTPSARLRKATHRRVRRNVPQWLSRFRKGLSGAGSCIRAFGGMLGGVALSCPWRAQGMQPGLLNPLGGQNEARGCPGRPTVQEDSTLRIGMHECTTRHRCPGTSVPGRAFGICANAANNHPRSTPQRN